MNDHSDELDLSDENLQWTVTELLQTDYCRTEDAKKLLDTILELRLDDVSMQSTVDECFVAITNLAGIPVSLTHLGSPDDEGWRDYAIRFFSKAIEVMESDLQMSVDFDERHQDTYVIKEYFLNDSDANYAYAKSIIENQIMKCFFDIPNESVEVISLLKKVSKPVYTIIKKIIIDDNEYNNLQDAQKRINAQLLEAAWCDELDSISFNMYLVLADKNELHEDIELDLSEMYDYDYFSHSLISNIIEHLFGMSDYEIVNLIKNPSQERYSIDLEQYKSMSFEAIDLSFLYKDIQDDLKALFSKGYQKHIMAIETLNDTLGAQLALETICGVYKDDLEKLDLKSREMHEKLRNTEEEHYIDTSKLKIFLPDYSLAEEKLFYTYLALKAYIANDYYPSFLDMNDILNNTTDSEYEPNRSISEVADLFSKYN